MANEVLPVPASGAADQVLEYVPFGESKPIKLTLRLVRSHIAVPTKEGNQPTDSDLIKFMMLCQARELNPWVGDAYLVGYDSKDGPKFSLITAVQALYKRAEANPNFDGIESGIIAIRGKHELVERPGDLVLEGEILVGSWARVWRRDRSRSFYDALKLSTYNKGYSQWQKDPAGMIVKCAEASVLRKAFPTQLGGLYIEQERGNLERRDVEPAAPTGERVTHVGPGVVSGSDLTKRTPPADNAAESKPAAPQGEKMPPPTYGVPGSGETKPAKTETPATQGETADPKSETPAEPVEANQAPTGEPSDEEKAAIAREEFAEACKEKFAAEFDTIQKCKSAGALDKVLAAIEKDSTWTEAEKTVGRSWTRAKRQALKGAK